MFFVFGPVWKLLQLSVNMFTVIKICNKSSKNLVKKVMQLKQGVKLYDMVW